MKPIPPTETLERLIRQGGITTGARKLELFKRALALRATPPLYSQETQKDPVVHIKIFDPAGAWTALITEWDRDDEVFGLTLGHEQEFGYLSLTELSEIPGSLGIGLEVDVWFLPMPLSEAVKDQ